MFIQLHGHQHLHLQCRRVVGIAMKSLRKGSRQGMLQQPSMSTVWNRMVGMTATKMTPGSLEVLGQMHAAHHSEMRAVHQQEPGTRS